MTYTLTMSGSFCILNYDRLLPRWPILTSSDIPGHTAYYSTICLTRMRQKKSPMRSPWWEWPWYATCCGLWDNTCWGTSCDIWDIPQESWHFFCSSALPQQPWIHSCKFPRKVFFSVCRTFSWSSASYFPGQSLHPGHLQYNRSHLLWHHVSALPPAPTVIE